VNGVHLGFCKSSDILGRTAQVREKALAYGFVSALYFIAGQPEIAAFALVELLLITRRGFVTMFSDILDDAARFLAQFPHFRQRRFDT
jgi:alkanesulfonate monooxygenase SsuD/methylene tetrahydromethanopterin reductase-like flavin-dependent oxidoreductase (luciferase family)